MAEQLRRAQDSGNGEEVIKLREQILSNQAASQELQAQLEAQRSTYERLRFPQNPGTALTTPFPAGALYLRRSLVEELKEAGYTDLSVDEIIEMARSGLTVEAMKAYVDMGWNGLDSAKMQELSKNGVTSGLLQALKDNGFGGVTPEMAIEAAQNGVRAQDVKTAKEYNDKLTLEDIIKLKRGGAL
jgi:hypothetical protein